MWEKQIISLWVILVVLCSMTSSVFDVAALFTNSWGVTSLTYREYQWGLWKFCNESKVTDERECHRINVKYDHDWIYLAQGVDILAVLFGLCSFFTCLALMCSLKLDWISSRLAVVIIVPISFAAALFNLISSAVFGTNLSNEFQARIDYSQIFNIISTILYTFSAIFAIFDLQNVCLKKQPTGKGLIRPI